MVECAGCSPAGTSVSTEELETLPEFLEGHDMSGIPKESVV